MLILSVTEDFHKLFQDRSLTAVTSLCKSCGVMIMAVDSTFMFVVAILGAERCGTHRTRKVVNVIFMVQRSNVGAP